MLIPGRYLLPFPLHYRCLLWVERTSSLALAAAQRTEAVAVIEMKEMKTLKKTKNKKNTYNDLKKVAAARENSRKRKEQS